MIKRLWLLIVSIGIALLSCLQVRTVSAEINSSMAELYAKENAASLRNGLAGWNILSDFYRNWNLLDGLSLEWDYFSIHDHQGKFTGVVAYLVADPSGLIGGSALKPKLMPSGANMACFGRVTATNQKYADFKNFGLAFQAGSGERSFLAEDLVDQSYGAMIPLKAEDGKPERLNLRGKTKHFQWDLEVSPMWAGNKSYPDCAEPNYALNKETWVVGNDLPILDLVLPRLKQHWTVNMSWPSTKVTGWLVDLTTGEKMEIDGHGYRENSFGRWAFLTGGWDFYFMSDPKNKVQWTLQTYHHDTEELDYVDLDFLDQGIPKSVRFFAKDNELGWKHNQWQWSEEAHQWRPLDTYVLARNSDYTVEVEIEIDNNYAVLLSKTTVMTNAYQITTMFPEFKGKIYRTKNKELVTEFAGVGGGEFSLAKNLLDPAINANEIGMKYYSHPMPK